MNNASCINLHPCSCFVLFLVFWGFAKCSELAKPCWLADIGLWWWVFVFTLADTPLMQADGTWLSGFAGGPSICLHQGLSSDNEKRLLQQKWLVELKGQYRLIRKFTSGDPLAGESSICLNTISYCKARKSKSRHLMYCTKIQFKWLALTVRSHAHCHPGIYIIVTSDIMWWYMIPPMPLFSSNP